MIGDIWVVEILGVHSLESIGTLKRSGKTLM